MFDEKNRIENMKKKKYTGKYLYACDPMCVLPHFVAKMFKIYL